MLMWVTLVIGSAVILGGAVLMSHVDRRWRSVHLQCCRCLEVWFSTEKTCGRCGAHGNTYDWLARQFAGFPTHDWQGYLATGPITVVRPALRRQPADPADLPTAALPMQRFGAVPIGPVLDRAGVGAAGVGVAR